VKSHNEVQQNFIRLRELKRHSLRRHKDVKPYVCSECPKRFCTAYELRHHLQVESYFRQFYCGLCGKHFILKRTVIGHFQRCSKKFGLGNVLSALFPGFMPVN